MPPLRGVIRRIVLSSGAGIRHASSATSWATAVADTRHKVQSYVSRSRDPFLNLSIEHYLLQSTPPESTVLFLYINRPSIIIGRNQNPWLEVNLGLLNAANASPNKPTEPPGLGAVDLVRRRSGGGTVFHDEGNVNWTVICPPASFTRDKHAEMVVRALRELGVGRARVNERHDVVLDQAEKGSSKHLEKDDTHRTQYTSSDPNTPRPLKVSGSAYKLTRLRALHHGTCLLSSPNLNVIPHYLHSPARPYIKARGVDSVSSPVGNIGLENHEFTHAVSKEFAAMYGRETLNEEVGEELSQVEKIRKGCEELKSMDWTYGQTPQFTFSSYPTEEDDRPRPDMSGVLADTRLYVKARYGSVVAAELSVGPHTTSDSTIANAFKQRIKDRKLYELDDWTNVLRAERAQDDSEIETLAEWLNDTFVLRSR
ncbi:hypothetical protein LTS18_004633 [Coniosporium uncinatum]|uniref:Uncharacterized protein n=1 Tax=Coniosporium uncinatum TaxID=93489 RepID=A0ACC3D5G7_9PEZI|nr:hypothetical protein LTS18_004633 [Coniosporium uncinatum]